MAGLEVCLCSTNAAIWKCQVLVSSITNRNIKPTGFHRGGNHEATQEQPRKIFPEWLGTRLKKRCPQHRGVWYKRKMKTCWMKYMVKPKSVISRVGICICEDLVGTEGSLCMEYATSDEDILKFSEEKTKALNVHLLGRERFWKDKGYLQSLEDALQRSPQDPDLWDKLKGDPSEMTNQNRRIHSGSAECMLATQVECDARRLQECLKPENDFHRLCDDGQVDMALNVLDQQGSVPSMNMYMSLLSACAKQKSLAQAKVVHSHLDQHAGLALTRALGDCLVSTLVTCGAIEDALQVFHRLPHQTVFSWTSIISGYTTCGRSEEALRMYECMKEDGVQPNSYTFVSLLKACGRIADLEEGKRIHAEALKCRSGNLFVQTCLVDMYRKCGSLVDAQHVFDGLFQRDVVAWTAMLTAYVEQGQAAKALELYEQMQEENVSPDARTIVIVLQACSIMAEKEEGNQKDGRNTTVMYLGKGKALHAHAWKKGCQSDAFVCNTLVSMYGKCGSIMDAHNVFDGLPKRDVVSWNVMLVAYAKQGQAEKVFQLYGQMREAGVSPDVRTFVSVLQACVLLAEKEVGVRVDGQTVKLKCLEMGRAIHADASLKDYAFDVFIENTLVNVYGKSGSIIDARNVFDGMCKRDVVSWTVMLMAYVEQDQGEKALQLYREMQQRGGSPDEMTTVWVLQACSNTGNLNVLKQIHHTLAIAGNIVNPFIASTLICAYGRCASMVDAQAVFDSLPQPEVVSWTALIAGYARQGDCTASLQLYEEMKLAGVLPNGVTFLSLLSACSHAGIVEKGVEHFESMIKDHGITPGIEHYVNMVDLLGRTGHFLRIEQLLSAMPMRPNLAMWLCLLGACRKHGKVVLGEQAFHGALHLQPTNAAAYLLMSNIYADAGLLQQAERLMNMAQQGVANEELGRSWIHHEQDVHTFLVGNTRHPQQHQFFLLLRTVNTKLTCKLIE